MLHAFFLPDFFMYVQNTDRGGRFYLVWVCNWFWHNNRIRYYTWFWHFPKTKICRAIRTQITFFPPNIATATSSIITIDIYLPVVWQNPRRGIERLKTGCIVVVAFCTAAFFVHWLLALYVYEYDLKQSSVCSIWVKYKVFAWLLESRTSIVAWRILSGGGARLTNGGTKGQTGQHGAKMTPSSR